MTYDDIGLDQAVINSVMRLALLRLHNKIAMRLIFGIYLSMIIRFCSPVQILTIGL